MYYLISFVYNQSLLYCIWVSNDEDYVITKDNKVLFFYTIDDLKDYERSNNIIVKTNDDIRYNIDEMNLWCEDSNNLDCDCEQILNFWNICSDIAKSLKINFTGNESMYDDLYEKIFSANDLFSANPIPSISLLEFSQEEIIDIKRILKEGIKIIIKE